MSTQAEEHVWEELLNEHPHWTWRMRVPGGWIYKDIYLERDEVDKGRKVAAVSMVFVLDRGRSGSNI
jgi:hypothetical protein